jgi:hypothetical protein
MKSFTINSFFILVAVLFCTNGKVYAQKNYDYQDTRKKNESFARLQPRDLRSDVAIFTLSGISESVGALPLAKINYTNFGKDFMDFEGDGIKVSVRTAPFDSTKHKLQFDEKYLIKIDKRPYYGNYGNMPLTTISNITMTVNGDTVSIPEFAYNDLHNINFDYTNKGVKRTTNGVFRSKDGHRIYIYLFSKDNTGSYEVTWIIQDKKYVRRVLDYGFM